jgi:hypothetical protein
VVIGNEVEALGVLKVSHLRTQPEMTSVSKQKGAVVTTGTTRIGDIDVRVEMNIPNIAVLRTTHHLVHTVEDHEVLSRNRYLLDFPRFCTSPAHMVLIIHML